MHISNLTTYSERKIARASHRSAFTLIELSIVLVIIGLVIGGVLVARDMMAAAEMRQQLSQIESINTTVNTFRLKHDCLPGDCSKATQFFSAGSQPEGVTNGNGDGIISSGYNAYHVNMYWLPTGEWSYAWDHLAAAGLVSLAQFNETDYTQATIPGIGFPKLKFQDKGPGHSQYPWGGNTTLNSFDSAGGIVFGNQPAMPYSPWYPSGHLIRLSARHMAYAGAQNGLGFVRGVNPWNAKSMDEKMDDGKPMSGRFVAGDDDYWVTRVDGSPNGYFSALCNPTGVNEYRTATTLRASDGSYVYRACSISVKAQF